MDIDGLVSEDSRKGFWGSRCEDLESGGMSVVIVVRVLCAAGIAVRILILEVT